MAQITKQYTFTNGTKADPVQVNADLDALYTQVNSQDTSITTSTNNIGILSKRIYSPFSYGAIGDGVADDLAAINAAISAANTAGGGTVPINNTFKITNTINVYSNVVIDGSGTIDASGLPALKDALLMVGSNTSGSESQNIIIRNITIKNSTQFGVQAYGETYTYKPHDITIDNVTTINCSQGGIFINSCYEVKISRCKNSGGARGIGTKSPIVSPIDCYNILIEQCMTEKTTAFGFQTYYGKHISIIGCHADGSFQTTGDKSCITVDRSKHVTVSGNVVKNAVNSQIFITGTEEVTVSGNTCLGGQYGIQGIYNNENGEDPAIHEAIGITVIGNTVYGSTLNGIIFNGVQYGSIVGNVIKGVTQDAVYIMQAIRTTDSVQMTTNYIKIIGNVADKGYNNPNVANAVTLIGNQFTGYTGLTPGDITLDANYSAVNFGGLQVQNFGLLKRSGLTDGAWIQEYDAIGFDSLALVMRSSGLGLRDITSNIESIALDYKNGNATFLKGVTGGADVTANRPTVHPSGTMFFDTTLGKPIWWNGTVWKDATGVTV